jgi:hypothetical protein
MTEQNENEQLTLTARQKQALRGLLIEFPAGLIYNDDKVEQRRLFDSLVEVGAATKAEVKGGAGYQISPEMFAAFGISTIKKNARDAELN